jgi:formamidase
MTEETLRIRLDLGRPLVVAPEFGHNRWHPDIPPIARVRSGQRIEFDARDGLDQLVTETTEVGDLASMDMNRGHPLTGPFYVEEAEPGDYLDIEIHEVVSAGFGFTCVIPGFGLLADDFDEPFVAKWSIENGVARSADIPGVAIRGQPFLGLIGVAPSKERLTAFARREADLGRRGAFVLSPDPKSAIPASGRAATDGLRTVPPRETGGNMDIKHLRAGTRLMLPVDVPGALVSFGDIHFAQGDGESCGVAIEVAGSATVSCHVRKQTGQTWQPRNPVYEFAQTDQPQPGARYLATTGIPVTTDGENRDLDVYLAAQQALREMVNYLVEDRGLTRNQAYVLVSVAADLQISSIVNVPNTVVSAVLPMAIFDEEQRP